MKEEDIRMHKLDHKLYHKLVLIQQEIGQHPTMSSKATVVIFYLLSSEPDNPFCTEDVWKNKNISEDEVWSAISELINLGYIDEKSGDILFT